MTPSDHRPLRTFGRIKSRPIKPRQAALFDTLLPSIAVPDPTAGPVDPRVLMPEATEAWLEIGFGGGEHLAAQAAAHSDIGLLGVEPFINGVAKLLRTVEQQGLANVRVLMDDARLLLAALPDASLARAFVLFPDPWPKARHHKRRIVNAATLAELARVLAPEAELRLATDDPDYARWMLAAGLAESRLVWTAERAADWREPPPGWVTTRYEAKARRAARRPVFLTFRRRA